MNKTNDLDEIANNLVKVVNTGIDRMILWEVDGTDIEELEDSYFNILSHYNLICCVLILYILIVF